ncbi:MAG TPA: response regulator [Methylovirgula sp.]|nr:response regulator [Methylovirgula sp.]
MIPKKASAPASYPTSGAIAPRHRPHLLFARDDAANAGKSAAEPARILIVEDDYLISAEIEAALIDAGFDVVGIASSAEEACELVEARRPALAIMDIRLRGKRDGVDAALDIFRRQGIRSIFATAHHDAEIRARAQAAQPLAWVPKPYSMASLIEVIRGALRNLRHENN